MFEKIGYMLGYIKLLIYKIYYGKRLTLSKKMRVMPSIKIYIEKNAQITLGHNFSCRSGVVLRASEGAMINVGERVFVNYNSIIVAKNKITIGDGTVIASGVNIYDHNHVYGKNIAIRESGYFGRDIFIGKNVWCGANSIILAGSQLGDNVVVAAGTIINKTIDNDNLVYNKRELGIRSFDIKEVV